MSKSLKVADQEYAVERLVYAADQLAYALENDDDESKVRERLNRIFPDYVAVDGTQDTKARYAAYLKQGKSTWFGSQGLSVAPAVIELKKRPRSFGD